MIWKSIVAQYNTRDVKPIRSMRVCETGRALRPELLRWPLLSAQTQYQPRSVPSVRPGHTKSVQVLPEVRRGHSGDSRDCHEATVAAPKKEEAEWDAYIDDLANGGLTLDLTH